MSLCIIGKMSIDLFSPYSHTLMPLCESHKVRLKSEMCVCAVAEIN